METDHKRLFIGNSGGNLNEYWDAFRRFPRLQGGFIWDWVDQGISMIDSTGKLKYGYGGDFGESSHDSNFCLNGLNWPDRGLSWVNQQTMSSKWGNPKPYLNIPNNSHGLKSKLPQNDIIKSTINVESSISKPQLLEAKQCQKCFECKVIGIKLPGKLVYYLDLYSLIDLFTFFFLFD